MAGDPRIRYQHAPLQAVRRADTFEQKYGIPRADWDWALRGQDRVFHEIMEQQRGPPSTRALFFYLTLYMDKFRRGDLNFLCFC